MTGLEIGLATALYLVVAGFLGFLMLLSGEHPAMYLYAALWPVAIPIAGLAATIEIAQEWVLERWQR